MGDQMQGEGEDQTSSPVFSHSRTTPDLKRIAHLRVFPNRHFRDGWNTHSDIPCYDHTPRKSARAVTQIRALLESTVLSLDKASRPSNLPNPPATPKQFKDACSAWIAVYDVYSIEYFQYTRSTSIEINLSRFDVELCLRQGLCAHDEEWVCAFPLSISPDLKMFTVLHNLVCVDNDKLFKKVIPLYGPFARRWQGWSKLKSGGAKGLEADRSDIYRYQFTWSLDGKYLLFHDFQMQPISWDNNGTCAIVHAISNGSDGEKKVRPVNFFASLSFSSGIQNCQFHPTEALLLFRDELNTYLWRFLKDSRPMVLDLDGPKGQRASLVKRVSFSTCGKYLAVLRRRGEWPQLIDLGDFLSLFFSHSPSILGDASTIRHDVSPSAGYYFY